METINSGMVLKIMVEADQVERIFSSVDEEVSFTNQGWTFTGTLLSVSSKKRKSEDGEVAIWKQLSILIENISVQDEKYSFVDKKEFFINVVNFDGIV